MTLAERLRIALRRGHAAEVILEKAEVEGLRSEHGVPFAAAAVLIAVTDRPEPGLILTQRTAHLRKHAGQIAFPGGRVADPDKEVTNPALREAEKEPAKPPT